ncbi:hypothetical protein [Streptomyces sp. NK15101]|uniref:hypothetical protein n=1 Tax=Streptomyces sp. NK15101 TaxID=2873261 RepID=UPI001CED40AF|nr:hypothetical protein [Streptomyces sp. NK15101]
MPRLLPLIVIAVALYLWWKSRRSRGAAAPAAEAPRVSARALELGFLPEDRLDTERSRPREPHVAAAVAAARAGDWEPGAALLAPTVDGPDWELRTGLVGALGDVAVDDDAWLTAWEKAEPENPSAAAVRAWSTVGLAGKLRGSARASETSREQFDDFHRMMARADEEITRAAELNPADPTPLVSAVWVALSLGSSHEEMRELWKRIVDRAPHHYDAHFAALQYWCQKWRGSVELATGFATSAAATAPRGSLLTALPLISWYEHESFGHTKKGFTGPEVSALVDALAADVAAARPDDPHLPEARLLLAWYLVRLERHAEALAQFRIVDGFIGAFPWNYQSDPAGAYVRAREKAIAGAS